jgi:hypothetical protein
VLQEGSLEGGKGGGQLTPFKTAPNFEITDLRNLPMHKRPCGARSAGHMGYAVAVDTANGLYRSHPTYRSYSSTLPNSVLAFDCAERPGLDTAVLTLTDAHIIS